MSLSVQIDVSGDAQVIKMLGRLHADLTDRTPVHESIGTQAEQITRQHLTALAGTRHDTARRLGAKPTDHLARAAESVTSRGTRDAAIITVVSPGISRAFGDLTITPKSGKYLTIPAAAEAYGKRARSFNDLRVAFFGRGRMALVRDDPGGGGSELLYWLKKSVTQKQDRTLLPPDKDFAAAAVKGIAAYIQTWRAAVYSNT